MATLTVTLIVIGVFAMLTVILENIVAVIDYYVEFKGEFSDIPKLFSCTQL